MLLLTWITIIQRGVSAILSTPVISVRVEYHTAYLHLNDVTSQNKWPSNGLGVSCLKGVKIQQTYTLCFCI